ncbi:EAL domain-containing protein [Oxalobacter formigenes]|uniref:Diguanylate cyclase (GGDEF) domain protein n=1 Tax=Oxalobacter formigenes OXCC13 TaxID=556269 RepID=C3XAF9_OXAFO|nr:EAL domain-containing protein [Oxalobacter formigenes]ARQ45666.1 putative signaling protein [Oxalobacter formigenes]ARQ77906.1 GGDEF domain-containing protein [Oxalobacter formigenes OXCC13]EEO30185.1 diguanylate cyclase (GGDEF) domain protein [Oxalobacter formigenes OXCC13]MCZ4063064.1 EAL domain-containing protein [Oxalobacter formigenes]QDX33547.1 EAL domain-containing protein [Oxalobacter formigenes]
MIKRADIADHLPGPEFSAAIPQRKNRRNRHKTILDNLPVGVLQISEDEQILFANSRFEEMLGYDPGKFPKTVKDLINPNTYFHTQHTWKDMWHTQRQFQVEIKFRNKNGLYMQTENIVKLILDEDNKPDFALIVSRLTDPEGKPFPDQHISLFDPLTSLPTRNYLDSFLDGAIERTRQSGKMLGILIFNINRFKIINESLGHDAGDALLKLFSKRLIHGIDERDTVVRLGGDEFVVILEKIDKASDIVAIATRLLKMVSEPSQLSGHDISIAVSIGGSIYPRDSTDANTLLKYAGVALTEARKRRSSVARFYNPDMIITPMQRLMHESELRRALDKNEFILYYQPRLSLATGKIVGLEALIRWKHPSEGIISAANFIPTAEEIGLIEKITEFTLTAVTRQLLDWQSRKVPVVPVALNVSSKDLYTPDLTQSILHIVTEMGLPPTLYELEITESSLIEDMDKVKTNLMEIRDLGVTISIDDFGTGYSSLRYLSSLPIDLLKIDGSFISGLTESDGIQSIIESTIDLAHSLGMPVIAEGVATHEQLAFLCTKGCDQIQGYLCSPPLPPEKVEIFLAKHQPSDLVCSNFK